MQLIPEKQHELKEVSTKFANKSLGEVTVSQVGLAEPPPHRPIPCSTPTTRHSPLTTHTHNSPPTQTVGGGRDVKCMLWDTSLLDAQEVRPRVCVYVCSCVRARRRAIAVDDADHHVLLDRVGMGDWIHGWSDW